MMKLSVYAVSVFLLFAGMQARAVDYKLPDINGDMQSLDQYKGKWLIVNYWATWCSTCMKELPDLFSLHEDNKNKDIAVVGINYESISQKRLKQFVENKLIPYRILRSKPVELTPLGRVPALPTTYIIDPEGRVVAGEVGIVTQKNIEDYIANKRFDNKQSSEKRVMRNVEVNQT